jgi:PhzF family phenazine biosynthesis protein
MELALYQVDGFANEIFEGNPAAVCPLDEWLDNETLQKIANENNLSETAFFVRKEEDGEFHLRWFTPLKEVALCGHATLATAHVLYEHLGEQSEELRFQTLSGVLTVRKGSHGYAMDFPLDVPHKVNRPELLEALHVEHGETLQGRSDVLVVLDSQEQVQALRPDFHKLSQIPVRGVIATAPGNTCDFVSRCFYPAFGIDEDPVTGSAHTTLAAYWSERLGKTTLQARQLSKRQGTVLCTIKDDRVLLEGNAVTYLKGSIFLPAMAIQ